MTKDIKVGDVFTKPNRYPMRVVAICGELYGMVSPEDNKRCWGWVTDEWFDYWGWEKVEKNK